MSRKSRLLYPVVFLLRLTEAQDAHVKAIGAHYGVRRAEAIRRCIEAHHAILFSTDRTNQSVDNTAHNNTASGS